MISRSFFVRSSTALHEKLEPQRTLGVAAAFQAKDYIREPSSASPRSELVPQRTDEPNEDRPEKR
jgi:hypothetical protein